jgi:hypothetical protein
MKEAKQNWIRSQINKLFFEKSEFQVQTFNGKKDIWGNLIISGTKNRLTQGILALLFSVERGKNGEFTK